MLTLANASRRPRLLTSGSGLQLFHPAGEWDPGLPSASDKGALSPETSGEQKQERIRAEGSTNTALSGFGSRFYSPGLSGNIWLAGRVSITQQFTSRAVKGSVVPSPATLWEGGGCLFDPLVHVCRFLLSPFYTFKLSGCSFSVLGTRAPQKQSIRIEAS